MGKFSETDKKILEVAKKMFMEDGLQNTEMKDIAERLNCDRSTLYRHFRNKGDILFVLAQETLKILEDATILPEGKDFANGFDALQYQINSMVKALILNAEAVTFLRDFDAFYTAEYPNSQQAKIYINSIVSSEASKSLWESLERGMKDGSIRQFENANLVVISLTQGCIATAQRILPREKHYIEEHGYGREILRCQMELLLNAIKA